MTENTEVTFGLVHGPWHGAWSWSLLQRDLRVLGYRSIAMDLPIDDPDANFDDYAQTVETALADETDIVLVGHSSAGNVLPRATGELAVNKLIYLGASFEPATIGRPLAKEQTGMPSRHTDDFMQGVIPLEGDMTRLNKATATQLFYNDCTPEIQKWAIHNLRPGRHDLNDPGIEKWPDDIPQDYIVCGGDLVIRPEWQRYAAKKWLSTRPIEFPGGHAPFLSQPYELAKLLISLATGTFQAN